MRQTALFFLMLATAAPLHGQSADEKAVQSAVESFLTRLGDHQYDTLDADFTPKAIIVVTRQRPGSTEWTNSYQTAEEWMATLKKNPNPTTFREPITDVKVTIDSDRLAFLRADFQVIREGKAVSSGVDQFTLLREPSGWKIAAIAYTSMPK
jgi:hypothetical protein